MPWNRACPRPDRGTTRKDYKRNDKRYESDVTDKEWAIIEPMLPEQGPMGRPRQTDLREVLGAIQYVLATGCQWRALPRDFPPYPTVVNEDLQRCHGDISDIRSRRKDAARLRIGLEQSQPQLVLNFEEDQGALRVLPDAEWDMSKSKFPIRRGLARSLQAGAASRRSRRSGNILEAHYEFLVLLLLEIATATLFEKFPRDCYYLPAVIRIFCQKSRMEAALIILVQVVSKTWPPH